MVSIEPAGYESATERQLYVLELQEPGDIATVGNLPDRHFVCFIAWDAQDASAGAIAVLVKRLLDAGAAYISTWGIDCERVHDIADEIRPSVGGAADRTGSVVMTTWHEHESLEEALWYFLFSTIPDDSFEATTGSGLAVIVGNREWGATIRHDLRDPGAFSVRLLKDETRNA